MKSAFRKARHYQMHVSETELSSSVLKMPHLRCITFASCSIGGAGQTKRILNIKCNIKCTTGVQVWNADSFFWKNTLNCEQWCKGALFKVCSISCYTFSLSLKQFVNSMPVKIIPFCCEPFVESFFHIFVRIKALLGKCVKSSMQTNGNRKEPSLVSKPHGVEPPSWVFPTCREPVLPDVIMWWNIVKKKNDLVLPLSVRPLSDLFKEENGSNRSFSINRFPRF